MADRAKHAFGNLADVQAALDSGKIDAYDILFLDGDTEPKVGWIDKNKVFRLVENETDLSGIEAELDAKASTEEVEALEGKVATKADASNVVALEKEMANKANISDVTELEEEVANKVDAATVQAMIEEHSSSVIEVVEF